MARDSLEQHLGYWLRLVSNKVSNAFARAIQDEGVTVAEWVVLRQLGDRDDVAPSVLADSLGLTRGAVSRLVDRLERKRLISRTGSASDGRFQSLRLTDAARALVPRLSTIADRNDNQFFAVLPADRREALAAILRELADRHGTHEAPLS